MTTSNLAAMLGARSIAVVGASDRPGSFGRRLAAEALRSPSSPEVHLVNPRLRDLFGHGCVPSLADVPEPVDLVLLGVPDSALVDQLAVAAARGDAGAVVFGSAHGLAAQLKSAAAGMAVCGAGCMGFVNLAEGVRAVGYLEHDPLTPGPIALVTHSGSGFSALLRTHRRLEFSLAVSSGQELVTTAGDYLGYALQLEQTAVLGLVLETLRDVPKLREGLRKAAERDIPVVALTVGGSPTGRAMVSAHSGALAGDDAAWEALFAAHGVHRVRDLDEMADTLEVFAVGRRVVPTASAWSLPSASSASGSSRTLAAGSSGASGVATVHDSGAERALVADVADEVGVAFAGISSATQERLTGLLDAGLVGENPLDVWGTGADTEQLFTECLAAFADDGSVDVVALAVDLVREYDGDVSYPRAAENLLSRTTKPVVVLSNCAAAVDQSQAGPLRAIGIPVLEGTRSGLIALKHLLSHSQRQRRRIEVPVDARRQARWRAVLQPVASDASATTAAFAQSDASAALDPVTAFELLEDYGLRTAAPRLAETSSHALHIAETCGYPVVLKTGEAGIDHKTEVGGVAMGLIDAEAVADAFADISARLGGHVLVQAQVEAGVELALGVVRDPILGPLVLLAAGGTLIELLSQRRVALPPVSQAEADTMLSGLDAGRLLAGVRGRPAADRQAVLAAVVAVSQLALELGDLIEALDVNPLIVGPAGAVVVDCLAVPRR
ncbi:MAG: acetate--CoA ligase family protein [Nocardioidaceae bacterium]